MSRNSAIRTPPRLRRVVELADDLGPARGRALKGFFGVVLPVLAIGTELTTGGVRAYGYFDPLPSPLYVLMSALVPATVGWCLWGSARTQRARAARSFALGAATTVAVAYSLMFLPITTVAMLGIFFAGIGLLALAPMASMAALLAIVARALKRGVFQWRRAALGAGLALLLLAQDWAAQSITRALVERAGPSEPSEQRAALHWLRRVGHEGALASLARDEAPIHFPYAHQLPVGGVVSRATLWVGDVPRDAEFAERQRARDDYDACEADREESLLVSRSGDDGVVIEACLKTDAARARRLRLGFTLPLMAHGVGELSFGLPVTYDSQLRTHTLRLEVRGGQLAVGDLLRPDPQVTERAVWSGEIDAELLATHVARVRGEPARLIWAPGPRATEDDDVVVQEAVHTNGAPTSAVVLVMDGGRAMRDARRSLETLFAHWPETLPFAAYFAEDDVAELAPLGPATSTRRAAARAAFARVQYAGGIDAAPALTKALGVARAFGPEARVLWIHGPQAVLDPRSRSLWTAFTDEDLARITAVDSTERGNGLARRLARDDAAPLASVPRFVGTTTEPDLVADVALWLASGARASSQCATVRTIVTADSTLAAQAREASPTPTSDHVRRLAVAEAVAITASGGDEEARARAIALALGEQIVTAFTSAFSR